jgi:hypothetical protein
VVQGAHLPTIVVGKAVEPWCAEGASRGLVAIVAPDAVPANALHDQALRRASVRAVAGAGTTPTRGAPGQMLDSPRCRQGIVGRCLLASEEDPKGSAQQDVQDSTAGVEDSSQAIESVIVQADLPRSGEGHVLRGKAHVTSTRGKHNPGGDASERLVRTAPGCDETYRCPARLV